MNQSLLVLSFAAATSLASAAMAADFTLTVPIEFNHLPPTVDEAQLSCSVTGAGHIIGRGTVRFRFTGGEFHGEQTVAFNADVPAEAPLANQYTCTITDLWAHDATGGESGFLTSDYYTRPTRFFPVDPSAPFVSSTRSQPLP